jgi:hypothetical protein
MTSTDFDDIFSSKSSAASPLECNSGMKRKFWLSSNVPTMKRETNGSKNILPPFFFGTEEVAFKT